MRKVFFYLLLSLLLVLVSCEGKPTLGFGDARLNINDLVGEPTISGDGKTLISDRAKISYFTYTMEPQWTSSNYTILGSQEGTILYSEISTFQFSNYSQGEWRLTLTPYFDCNTSDTSDDVEYTPITKTIYINSFETTVIDLDLGITGSTGSNGSIYLGSATTDYTVAVMDTMANYGTTWRVVYTVTKAGASEGIATVIPSSALTPTEDLVSDNDYGFTKASISNYQLASNLSSGVYTVCVYIQENLNENWKKNSDGTWTNLLTNETISGNLTKTNSDDSSSRYVNAAGNVVSFISTGNKTTISGVAAETINLLTKDCVNFGLVPEDSATGLRCELVKTNDGYNYTYTCTVTSEKKPTHFFWIVNGVMQTSGITTADDNSSSVYTVTYAESETTNKNYSVTCAIADEDTTVSNTLYTEIGRKWNFTVTTVSHEASSSSYTRTFKATPQGDDITITSYDWTVKDAAGNNVSASMSVDPSTPDTVTITWGIGESGTYTVVCTAQSNVGAKTVETESFAVDTLDLDLVLGTPTVNTVATYTNSFTASSNLSDETFQKIVWYLTDPNGNEMDGTRQSKDAVSVVNFTYNVSKDGLVCGQYVVVCEAYVSATEYIRKTLVFFDNTLDWDISVSGSYTLTSDKISYHFLATKSNSEVNITEYTWTIKNSSGKTVYTVTTDTNEFVYEFSRVTQVGEYTVTCAATSGSETKSSVIDSIGVADTNWTLSLEMSKPYYNSETECTYTFTALPSNSGAQITTYTWYVNGQELEVHNASTLECTSTSTSETTEYTVQCVATNGVDADRESAVLTVTPVFRTWSVGITKSESKTWETHTATFVAAPSDSSTTVTSYTWYVVGNDTPIQTGRSNTCSYTVDSTDSYQVYCVATGGTGTVRSENVSVAPSFKAAPTVTFVSTSQSGATVTYNYSITGEFDESSDCKLVDAQGNTVASGTPSNGSVSFSKTFDPTSVSQATDFVYKCRVSYNDGKNYADSATKTVKVYKLSVTLGSWSSTYSTDSHYIYDITSSAKTLTIATDLTSITVLGYVSRGTNYSLSSVTNNGSGSTVTKGSTTPVSVNGTTYNMTKYTISNPGTISISSYRSNNYTSYVAIDKSQFVVIQ